MGFVHHDRIGAADIDVGGNGMGEVADVVGRRIGAADLANTDPGTALPGAPQG